MSLPVPIGVSDFRKLVEYRDSTGQGYAFADKTKFIKEIFDDGSEVIVITRPRRFGKTLNLSMLRYFFAKEINGESTKKIFDQLEISKDKACMAEQGKYSVIFITLKDLKQQSYDEAINKITLIVSRLYEEYKYLLSSNKLSQNEKNIINSFIDRNVNINLLQDFLIYLSQFLYKHHGVKPILLMDEYDTPIQESYLHGYYDDFIIFMRGLFGSGLKDNAFLTKSVITGIARVAKEGLFSGVNNINIYTFMQTRYGSSFGFSELEVKTLFEKVGVKYNAELVKNWYNGYQCGDNVLYNPWSILRCIGEDGKPGPYWINTSSNDLIKKLVLRSTEDVRDKMKQLLQNQEIEEMVDENVGFNNLTTSSSAIWSLLFMAGYLKVVSYQDNIYGGKKCVLKVPNMEILGMFKSIVVEWLVQTKGIGWYENLLNNLIEGKIEEFIETLRDLLEQTASYHDVGKNTQEAFYHGLLLGLIVGLGEQYIIKSNRESGKGRYDLMLAPRKDTQNRAGILIELKAAKESDDLQKLSKEAFTQIESQKYVAELQDFSVDKTIKLGIAFLGKDLEYSYAIS